MEKMNHQNKQKQISILGSTGSIGINTLDVIEKFHERFKVYGLSANKNIDLLEKQILKFSPQIVAVMDKEKACILKKKLKNHPVEIYSGQQGLIKVSTASKIDLVVSAIVGSAGLIPTLEAIKNGKTIALANKETLVMAGEIIIRLAKENNVNLMPIDSEHNAIFQCLEGKATSKVSRIILTASGGPFLDRKDLEDITPQQALLHPRWRMGNKISVDSATLMNKGLEIIEAHYLFGLSQERISVIIHPQSIIHSLVEFIDGSVIAQMSEPDMKLPISYAIAYPERLPNILPSLDLASITKLTFQEPDFERFPCLKYGYEAIEKGGTLPAVLNGANEAAVEEFLKGRIKFLDIPRIIRVVMDKHQIIASPDLNQILEADKWAREEVLAVKRLCQQGC